MSRYAVRQDACFSVNEDRTPLICYRSLFHAPESKKTLFRTAYNTTAAILDFTKAIDKVPHKRLIHKLNYYGITGSIATWIETFLTGRTQQVVVNGGNIIIDHSYLRCTPGNRSWATTFSSLHKLPTRQSIHKCTALCR